MFRSEWPLIKEEISSDCVLLRSETSETLRHSYWRRRAEQASHPHRSKALQASLDVHFILRVDIRKHQWKMKSTREEWRRGKGYDFLLLAHEHFLVFRKLEEDEKMIPFKDNVRWW